MTFFIQLSPFSRNTISKKAVPLLLWFNSSYSTMAERYIEAHKIENRRGPGDARPTALQIIEDYGRKGTMTDKVFIVTGASSGIGTETGR